MHPEPDSKNTEHDSTSESERDWRRQRAETERREIEESKRRFAEGESHAAKQLEARKKKGAAERFFAEAVEFARNQIKSDGLEG